MDDQELLRWLRQDSKDWGDDMGTTAAERIEQLKADYTAAYTMVEHYAAKHSKLTWENKDLKILLWYAWFEFNAIHARDGAPDSVSEEYWTELTNALRAILGDDLAKPWPPNGGKETLEEWSRKYDG